MSDLVVKAFCFSESQLAGDFAYVFLFLEQGSQESDGVSEEVLIIIRIFIE